MSKYLDKTFWKLLLGFFAIITFSIILIIATQIYKENKENQTASVIDAMVDNN